MDRTHRHQRKGARRRLGRLLPVLYRLRRSLPFGRDSVRPRTSQSPMSRHRPAVRGRVSTAVVDSRDRCGRGPLGPTGRGG